MHRGVHVIIDPRDHRHLEMVPGEHLWRLVDVDVSGLPVGDDVVLDLVEVDVRGPAVDVDYGEEQVLGGQHHAVELLLQMLRAP